MKTISVINACDGKSQEFEMSNENNFHKNTTEDITGKKMAATTKTITRQYYKYHLMSILSPNAIFLFICIQSYVVTEVLERCNNQR